MFKLIVMVVSSIMAMPFVYCGFFDLTDVDDPLSLLWQNKADTVIGPTVNRNRMCTTADGTTGTCMHQTLCSLQQGTSSRNQNCGLLSTCCIIQDNSDAIQTTTTRSKVSYFASGTTPTSAQYTVQVINNNICQMRLDFVTFTLTPATEIVDPVDTTRSQTLCQTDFMTIQPNTYNIPSAFCGENSGQHVYVHLNGQKTMTISMNIGTGTTTNIISARRWNIKITQLECPGPKNLLNKHKLNNNAFNDFNLLAPTGAIQYFTNPTGVVESFGYSDSYISGLNYAIAFKKSPTAQCIDFLANPIVLRHDSVTTTPVTDTDCTDYIGVPGLTNLPASESTTFPFVAKLCYANTDTHTFSEVTPGPLYIYFFSAPSHTTSTTTFRFRLQYELKTTCPAT